MSTKIQSAGEVPVSTEPTNPLRRPRDGRMPLRELAELYMRQYAGRDSTRVQRVSVWVAELGGKPIGDIIDDDVQDVLDDLRARPGRYFAGRDAAGAPILKAKARPITGSTCNRYTACLSALLAFAEQTLRILPRSWSNPCRTVIKQRENPAKTRCLDEAEIERLLSACRASPWDRMYALVLTTVCTGMRKGEVTNLRWRDVDLNAGHCTLELTKNGTTRVVPLLPQVVDELHRIKGKDAEGDLIFRSARRPDVPRSFESLWDAALKTAAIRGATFHTLRHSAASAMVRAGVTLVEVSKVLGHKDLSMTLRYSHLAVGHLNAAMARGLGTIGASTAAKPPATP